MRKQSNRMKISNNKKAERTFGKTIFRSLGLTALILTSFMFLVSCADSASDIADETGGITAAQIIENPSAYVGKTVTVSGDVEEIHDPRAFNMDSGMSVGELLVVGREPFPQLPEEGDRIFVINDVATVTGRIELLDETKIKDEIGWDLTPQILSDFKGKPVLIAEKTSFRAGKDGGNAPATTAPMSDNQTAANNNQTAMNDNRMAGENDGDKTAAGGKITDFGTYASASDKMSLADRDGEFSNLRVVRVVGPHTFSVATDAAGGDEMYVMLEDDAARAVGTQGKIDPGKTLDLTGTFEKLDMAEINDTASDRFRALTQTEREFMKKTRLFFQVNKVSNLK